MSSSRERSSILITWNPRKRKYVVQYEVDGRLGKAVHRAFEALSRRRRSYDADARCWIIHPAELERVREIAVTHFEVAQLMRGNRTENLHTGRVFQQLKLFR